MKRYYAVVALGAAVILGACEEQSATENQELQEQAEQEETGQQEVKVPQLTEQLKERLPDWNLALPSWTEEESQYIGATVVEEEDRVEVQFYRTEEPMVVDDPALANSQETAKLTIERFSSNEEANEQIGFQDYEEVGGEPVDLGYGITGYQDAGAGSLFTSWNEGRWAMIARTTTDASENGVELAQRTVSFLEEHTLPIPHEHGSLHLDVKEQGSLVKWQKGELVYTLAAATNDELLEWAVLFK